LIKATLIDHIGTELSVVNAARVSFGKSSTFDGRVGGPNVLKVADVKLVKYLAEHEHFSPFGHCFASFHVKAPIFVARQLVKHKFLRWNEISRRYVSDNPEFYRPDEWRGKSDDKKQGSAGVVEVEDVLEETHGQALVTYQELLDKGVCPEQARMVLPQSTMTEWYWSGSLDAFADMVKLRVSGDTQKETRDLAWQIDEAMLKLFPVSWDALVYGDDK